MTVASRHSAIEPPRLGGGPQAIRVGLVNNMPDAALRTTEAQIRDLLWRAAGDLPVTLTVFSLPSVPRSDIGRSYVEENHAPIRELWKHGVDGLIVTGTEPRAAALEHEPYWPELADLILWAEKNTISTAWSCLAAHAAAYLLNGIERQPLPGKLIGIFECEKMTDHPLLANSPLRWRVPHSRFNELPEDALVRAGYRILSRSQDVGADTFVREGDSLFLFLQGHPEYDSTSLFGEYRRDVRRYLTGERETYPELPCGYFSSAAAQALLVFREHALAERHAVLLERFPAAIAGRGIEVPWREPAERLYSNWLSYISRTRAERGRCEPKVSGAATSAALAQAH
jgi:homoserine O-succinyltransferase